MISFPLYSRLSCISPGIIRSIVNVNKHQKILNISQRKHFSFCKAVTLERQNGYVPVFLIYRYMAGHAKWQNIKFIKAEKDKQKSVLCNKYLRMVTAAVREKGPDPKSNIKLANILSEAKKENVPSDTLEKALKKASSKKLQTGTIELLGPGGCIIVMEYESDNVSEMRRALKLICRKHNAGIFPGGGGRWRAAYEQKGIIKVTGYLSGEAMEGEKMLDAAIEAGAEDVQKSEEDASYEFLCAPDDLLTVKCEIDKVFEVEEAYISYLPIATVKLDEQDKTLAMSFLNEISDLPDVSRLYENIE